MRRYRVNLDKLNLLSVLATLAAGGLLWWGFIELYYWRIGG